MADPALAYLIPEFPAQTHAFFWREAQALRTLNLQPVFLSTRPPDARLQSHAWTRDAADQTTYLTAFPNADALRACLALLTAGPVGWCRALATAAALGQGQPLRKRLTPFALIPFAARLKALARRHRFTHVHAHSCANAATIACLAHALNGPSYSLTLHGPLRDYGPGQPTKWAHAAFAILITRKLEAEALDQLGDAVPTHRRIAPMGVDLTHFQRTTAYQPPHPSDPTPPRLFSCGRLNPVKGHAELIQAVALLRDRGTAAHLRIAGQDEQGGDGHAQTLRQLITDLGIGDRVELLGAVAEEQVRDEIEAAHCFVLASHHEPLGVALMEAMAMGCPVLTTDAGGVPELIDHGHDGWLIPPKDPDALADALAQLLANPDQLTTLAHAGRDKIAGAFHSGVSAVAIAELLAQTRGTAPHQGAPNTPLPAGEPA